LYTDYCGRFETKENTLNSQLGKQAGSALVWRAVQLGGIKIIFMVRLLVLAWLLVPEDFGLLAIATTAVGFLLKITDVGMIPALVQSTDAEKKYYDAAWTVNVIRAFFISGIVFLTAPFIAQIFAEPRAAPVIQVLALRPLLEATASIRVATLTRNLEFRPLSILKLAEAVVNTIISIMLAPFYGVWALVAGTLAGAMSYLLISYFLAPHRPRLDFDQSAIRPLIRFGRWIFLTSLIVIAGNYVLQIVISRQLGTAELGLYVLAAQLAFLPFEVAGQVVGAVTFPLIARLQSDLHQVVQTFRTTLIGLSTLLFPTCALLIVLAPTLVQEILGLRWEGTVPIIRVLTLVSLIGLFGDVTGPIFNGLGQPYKITVIEIVQSLLLIAFVWSLTSRYGLVGAALAWLPRVCISQIISVIFVRQLLPQPFAGLGAVMLLITVASGIGAIVALSIDLIFPGLTGFVAACLLAVITTGGLLWASDRYFALGLGQGLRQLFPQIATLSGFSPAKS
jgi:lipopolysaccharide exporter